MKFPGRKLSIPYGIFMVLFVVLPLIIVLYYAFTDGSGQPTIENFLEFFQSKRIQATLFYSLLIGVLTTAFCLLLAYPTAYILARGYVRKPRLILMMFITPMWINSVLRLTALKEILSAIEGNIAYYPFINTILGMSYDFLPFMILPIYNSITKIDASMWEAAADLGAGKRATLWKVMLPLSKPGIISGITMVFLPAMTNYVVLDLMYNSTYIMGSLIGSYFSAYDWHNGAMISAVLLTLIALLNLFDTDEEKVKTEKGGVLS